MLNVVMLSVVAPHCFQPFTLKPCHLWNIKKQEHSTMSCQFHHNAIWLPKQFFQTTNLIQKDKVNAFKRQRGATTLCMTTFSIMTLGITTLCIMALIMLKFS